jgi:two-component system sensor histidine kinase BaeS
MFHSLATRMAAGFVTVGVLGALLVAVIIGWRVESAFDRFVVERDRDRIIELLADWHTRNGGWDGVTDFMQRDRALRVVAAQLVIVDAGNGRVYGVDPQMVRTLPLRGTLPAWPIMVDGQQVGLLLVATDRVNRMMPGMAGTMETSERQFLMTVRTAALASAAIATLVALLLGGWLSRTLLRPVRELTTATQAIADGQLGLQVPVRQQDEIGRLATAFNRMSHDLARATTQQKQMTADVAHDLRTPLSILRGYTEGLQDGSLTSSPRLYDIMHGEVLHLERLVNDLRLLSLADAGALTLNRRPTDPRALLERTGLKYVVQAEAQGVQLRIETGDQLLPPISADPDRMTQVLNNLVSNALAHTTEGEIVLAARLDGDGMLLSVRDSGQGIAPEALPHIFDRFYRADESRQRGDHPYNGASGLGLAIAKALVEAHGGTISAESRPRHGTTFLIRLPLSPLPAFP